MPEPVLKTRKSLYDRDFFAWSQEQARLLKARSAAALDWANLAEEIESVGGRERNEIWSRLIVLMAHLLKWEFQSERRGHSWQSTVSEQRIHIEGVIEASPSLKSYPAEVFADCYRRARRMAAQQTRLSQTIFPEEPPFSLREALDHSFMPGKPWSPEDLS